MMEGRTFETSVSVTTIYSYIKKGLFLQITQVDLPRHGKHKQGYKKVKTKDDQARASAGDSIEQRPPEVESREEFGHWEGDTVYSGKGKCKTTSALLTLNERKTRKDIIIGIPNRKAETVVKALDALERKCGAKRFRVIFKASPLTTAQNFRRRRSWSGALSTRPSRAPRYISAIRILRGNGGATRTPTA